MKDQCVTCYGLTQMIDMDGVFHLEEQVLHLDKISPNNLITPMISNWWLELINS